MEDSAFQKDMTDVGARVPPGRMGTAKDLASVSSSLVLALVFLSLVITLELFSFGRMTDKVSCSFPHQCLLTLATNEYIWGVNLVVDGGIVQSVAGNT